MNRTRLAALAASVPLALTFGLGAFTGSAAAQPPTRNVMFVCEAVTAQPAASLYFVEGLRCTANKELPLVGVAEDVSIEQINTRLIYKCETAEYEATEVPGTSNVVGSGCE